MNEFTAKKLGEVLAFAEVGIETFEKGRDALTSVLGADMLESLIEESEMHASSIRKIATDEGTLDIVQKKLDGTGAKLRAMRDLYVGDQWDNPTELLEWSGFFEGAATVHWALVKGAAEAKEDKDLITLAETGLHRHHRMLEKASELLHLVGKKKGTA
ncbi:MAG: hypothetical protein NTV02_03100 [Candidatus Zambryskibacteria bacterium]|nr:hypothetical protein [Candidatus Zambryskibacteria bacterium]